MSPTTPCRRDLWAAQLAAEPLASVRRALDENEDMLSFPAACGLLAAVTTSPERVTPSVWLDLIKSDHVFEGLEEVQVFSEGVMALYNAVADSVAQRGAHCCPPPEDSEALQAFCEAYVSVASLDATWEADPQAFSELLPLFVLGGLTPLEKLQPLLPEAADDPEAWLRKAADELPHTLSSLHAYWAPAREGGTGEAKPPARREGPKVGRNDPCPCGSGKKFKRCCAN